MDNMDFLKAARPTSFSGYLPHVRRFYLNQFDVRYMSEQPLA
jgi:hypothetical protein